MPVILSYRVWLDTIQKETLVRFENASLFFWYQNIINKSFISASMLQLDRKIYSWIKACFIFYALSIFIYKNLWSNAKKTAQQRCSSLDYYETWYIFETTKLVYTMQIKYTKIWVAYLISITLFCMLFKIISYIGLGVLWPYIK